MVQFPPASSEESKTAYSDFLLGLDIINQQEYLTPEFAPLAPYDSGTAVDSGNLKSVAEDDWSIQEQEPHGVFNLATTERRLRKAMNKPFGPSSTRTDLMHSCLSFILECVLRAFVR